ncbi:MAG TPA: hypothetical protein VF134_00760 [Candidatus Dormibacteraeota bacterium]
MSRTSALARLAAAYGAHQIRRRVLRRPPPGAERLLETYAPDRLLPLRSAERDVLPAASRCINCGLCSVVAARVDGLRPADLASSYLRDYPRLALARSEVLGWSGASETAADPVLPSPSLAAAAAACPVGVPLEGVLEMIRRLASS